jgi:predicted acyl esterase
MHLVQPRSIGSVGALACALLTASVVLSGSGSLDAAEPPSAPAYQVEMQEAWIEMPDGVRLAADLFVPTGEMHGKTFPVIL